MKRGNSMRLALHRRATRALALAPLTFLVVAGAGCPSLFESRSQRAAKVKQAEPGKDLAKTVTSTTGEIVNGYAALAANVEANATSVTFANADAKFTVAKGDLLLIIQMQMDDSTKMTSTDTITYGSLPTDPAQLETALGSAGRYEFVGVEAVATNTITLACGLKHAYTTAGKTQLIRVPQYTTLTIDGTAKIIPQLWNGTTGGIVAVHATTVTVNGTIDVSASGFRGGPAHDTDGTLGGSSPYATDSDTGAEKGESIAGYMASYGTTTRYGRGAPANGGGGGDEHNGGGGGGANAGLVSGWTRGIGVAAGWTNTTGWNACVDTNQNPWRLDTEYSTCAAWSSEGGGRGGYSWSNSDQNAVNVGPGDSDWAGDNRRNVGGLGGRPLASSPATRLFLGGGGGAGDGNGGRAGGGGKGGGMVFLIAGTVAGTGSLLANGEAGGDDLTGGSGDAGGGGGGGGTVVVHATSIEATVKIHANGGTGGRNLYSGGANEVEGPGGGGGGGYIALSGGTPTELQANGGPAGTTSRTGLSEFQENGATAGHVGITNGSALSFFYCPDAVTGTTIGTPRPANPTNDKTGDFTFSNPASGVTFQCKISPPAADFTTCTSPFTTPELADGAHTLTVRAVDSYGNTEVDPPTYTWTVDTVAPVTDFSTKPTDPSSSAVGGFVFSPSEQPVTYKCQLDPSSLPLQEANWVACNAGTFASPDNNYSTPALGNGPHTLYVRATDAAGNVEASPPHWTWTLDVVYLDGGALDAEPVDVGTTLDTEPVLDTGPADADARLDVALDLPVDRPADTRDVAVISDVAPVIDTRIIDSTGEGGTLADIGGRTDAQSGPEAADAVPDTQPSGAEPGPDTAPVTGPDPSPDTAPPSKDDAAPSPNADTAIPANTDAAVTPTPTPPTYVKYMGGGFCTVSGARQASPLAFVLLALAGVAVLRRRRR
jgi:MYXO-CTERM domain-containing protein